MKCCLFIDGLDEYSRNLANVIGFLKCLTIKKKLKIVVSSRPILACVQAFSSEPKLFLQDLTHEDIKIYIHQSIGSHPHMDILRYENPDEATKLCTDLLQKAYGDFLWVVLACRSLLEGLANYDRWSDFQRRIDELSPELEQLFQHVLSSIEGRYQAEAAKLLEICHQNCIVPGVERLSTLGLALVDDYDMNLDQIPAFPILGNVEKHAKCAVLEGRLQSRCYGLIEIRRVYSKEGDICFCKHWSRPVDAHDPLIDSTVEFMHRSVFDFLSTQDFIDFKHGMKDRDQTFDANAVLS